MAEQILHDFKTSALTGQQKKKWIETITMG